jgi:hypothetical protein
MMRLATATSISASMIMISPRNQYATARQNAGSKGHGLGAFRFFSVTFLPFECCRTGGRRCGLPWRPARAARQMSEQRRARSQPVPGRSAGLTGSEGRVDPLAIRLGLGELLLGVRQGFLLGLAVDGAEPLPDLGDLVGYPGFGGLTLTHGTRCRGIHHGPQVSLWLARVVAVGEFVRAAGNGPVRRSSCRQPMSKIIG